jgi:hypothetical protein
MKVFVFIVILDKNTNKAVTNAIDQGDVKLYAPVYKFKISTEFSIRKPQEQNTHHLNIIKQRRSAICSLQCHIYDSHLFTAVPHI